MNGSQADQLNVLPDTQRQFQYLRSRENTLNLFYVTTGLPMLLQQTVMNPSNFEQKRQSQKLHFNCQQLFGNLTNNLVMSALQEFSSKDTNATSTYIQAKFQYLVDHQFPTQVEQPKNAWDLNLVKLWIVNTRASSHTTKSMKSKPNVVFVKRITMLHKNKNVLLQIISQSQVGQDLSSAIKYQTLEGHDFLIP